MRYEERPMNGHHHPNWDLFGIVLGIQGSVSRVEALLERTHDQMTSGLDRAHDRIDTLHDRIDTHLVAPKAEKRGWIASLGLSGVKEAIFLAAVIIAGLTGGLTWDKLLEHLK